MILPRIPDAALTPAQRRIRRANAIAAATHEPAGAEAAPEVCTASVESASPSAPVVLPADAVEALADAFGVAAVTIHDGILSASLPTIGAGRVVICTPGPEPCRHYVYAGVCIKCGQRDGAA